MRRSDASNSPFKLQKMGYNIESGKSAPLSTATSGYHYHLIAADDEEAFETIGRALADKGYLAPLLPHEMPK